MIPKTLILTIFLTSTSVLAADWSNLGERLTNAGKQTWDNTIKAVEPEAAKVVKLVTEIAEKVAEKAVKDPNEL